MKKVLLSDLEDFLRHGLKRKLARDLHQLKIIKEADIECCAFYHIRRFIRGDVRWRVFARKHSPQTGYYTDLVVFKRFKAQLAVEIKWNRRVISKKDRRALAKMRSSLRVKKSYFICVIPDGRYVKVSKHQSERYCFFEIVVTLGFKGKTAQEKVKRWKQERTKFRI